MSPIRSDDSDVYEYLKDITERFHVFEDLKLAALYTDYSEGTFQSPDEIIKRDIAYNFLKLAKGRLRTIEAIEKITVGKIKDADIETIKAFGKKLGLINENL
ncbi:MAG: AbiV family abortive infection protein [archaeon]|nr:AbiV family abortive infection protein [archaeon]MCP8314679.1 AbiV family abortive infection protein [archaeon]